jgi:hypothetical protein
LHAVESSPGRRRNQKISCSPGREIGDKTAVHAATIVALGLLTAGSAHADVVVQDGVPFTAAQLEAAIAVRTSSGEHRPDLEVASVRPGRLVLVASGRRWEIDIGRAGGAAAARVVALFVIELGVDVVVRQVPAAAPGAAEGIAPRAAEAPDRYRLAVLGLGSRGMDAGDFAWAGGAVELTHIGTWIAGGGLSWQYGLPIERAPGMPISAELLRARLVGGVALGPLELVAGGFAGRLFVTSGSDVLGRWSTGLLGETRAALPVSSAWALEIAAEAELFRERLEVDFGTQRIGATPRAALGVRLGLAWTESRPESRPEARPR